MDLKNLIGECTAYDFKLMLEERKPKSWLKSVSAFANGLGGSLFFGIDNDGIVRGLDDVQYVCEAISSKIRDYMDPLPEVELIPHRIDNLNVLQLKVRSGNYTPYYYVGDGQRMAFVRIGDESLPATSEQMLRLVLKGSNKTFDSLHTEFKAEDYSFTILANAFKTRTNQEWNKKYLMSFGLVANNGNLTNAGALFSDDCPLWQSRLYCTRWDGKTKGDAINDAEFTGNVLMLLREGMNFVKSNTKKGWEKLPRGRKNKPEYAERAVLEAMVNHFIHRDYTVMGSEVHLDIYDDRLAVTSPGGMYNGLLIQDLDIADVSSERRNPILANVMAQLDYMEKRGSGLTRICNETKALDGYRDELRPIFKSTPTQFQTIIFASIDMANVGDMSETKGLLKREGKDNTDSVSDKLSDKQQLSDKMKLLSDKLSDKLLLSPLHPDNTMIGEDAKRKMLEALVFLIDNPNSKTESISEALGLSKQSTRTYLQKLSEIGLVEPYGANKNRTYSLVDIFESETGLVEK